MKRRRTGRPTKHDFAAIVIPETPTDAAYGCDPILPASEQGAVPQEIMPDDESPTVSLRVAS